MIKRKICFLAVCFATVCFCLVFVFKVDFLFNMPTVGTEIILTGKLNKIEDKTYGKYLFMENAAGSFDGKSQSLGLVVLYISSAEYEFLDLKLGNVIRTDCKYTGFGQARNNGNFDELKYYSSLGVSGKFAVYNHESLKVINKQIDYVAQILYEFRLKIVETFENIANGAKEKAGIFSAIVVGDKQSIDSDVKELYQKNGISHILAVSGLHISFIGMGVLKILRKLFGTKISCIVSGIVMVLFCIMSGGSVSAIRATVMFLLRLLAMVCKKQYDMITAIGFSSIVLLASNPNYIYNLAFLLSFGAVCAISTTYGVVEKIVDSDNKLASSFIASTCVTLFTMPIVMSTYYEISLFSILLNIVIVPLMSFILGSGLFSGIVGLISIIFARFIIGLSVYLLYAIEIVCTVVDYIPFSVVITGKPSWWQVIIYYCILILASVGLCFLSKRKIKIQKAVFVIILAVLMLVIFIRPQSSELQIFVFDVDQGDGILIKAPSGTVYMIDGGSSTLKSVYNSRLESAIKYMGISTIDYSIITHTDTDHVSGIMEMIEDDGAGSIKVNNILMPYINDNDKYQEISDMAEKKGINVQNIFRGMSFSDGDLTIECLFPTTSYTAESVNAYSVVLSLEYGDFKGLFVGDLEPNGEDYLVNSGIGGYDFLKVAHHGSRYSSGAEFLSAAFRGVNNPIAAISAGVNNSYGHPHKETLNRLSDVNADVYCTADVGEIIVSVDRGGNAKVCID